MESLNQTHTVTELLDIYPTGDSVVKLDRNEEFLFTKPQLGPIKIQELEPLEVVHFPLEFVPKQFSPPLGIYESDYLRLEWQQMGNVRQPFYHRNLDVDELSYQVCGERTLMTENGTLEMRPGDFSRIPVGVAHDNFGRSEIHLLFYIIAPVTESVPSQGSGALLIPPFQGWNPRPIPEVHTECLGGPECVVAAALADEKMLLQKAEQIPEAARIQLVRPKKVAGEQEWLYKSENVWIAFQKSQPRYHAVYKRHARAEEIQCQISGRRSLITQRGTIELTPGDFVCIPMGVAFTDVAHETSEHITIITRYPAPRKAPVEKQAAPTTLSVIAELRRSSSCG